MTYLIGTDPNQIPTNADLGSLAFTDGKGVNSISVGTLTSNKPNKVTSVSSIRPTLDLNFLTKKLDSRVNFSRGSAATYTGSDGFIKYATSDEPRFDHDPLTGECKGLLIEESRTNLLPYTTTMIGGNWTTGNTTLSSTSATTSPDGTTNAYKLVETNFTGTHWMYQTINTTAYNGQDLTTSVYLKAAERRYACLSYGTNNYQLIVVDLQTGTVIGTADDPGDASILKSYSILPVGNGWYRCSITITDIPGNGSRGVLCLSPSTDTSIPTSGYGKNYAGDGTSGIYVWGPQCEVGAFASSYIPNTTASTLQRKYDLTYLSDVSWFNKSQGTFHIRGTTPSTSKTRYIAYLSNLTAAGGTERVQIAMNTSNNTTCALVTGGNVILAGTYDTIVSDTLNLCFTYDSTSARSMRNSLIYDEPLMTTSTLPDIKYMYLGVGISTGSIQGYLKRVTYYSKKFSKAELQEITK